MNRHVFTDEERGRSGRKKIGTSRSVTLPDQIWNLFDREAAILSQTGNKRVTAVQLIREIALEKKDMLGIRRKKNRKLRKVIDDIKHVLKTSGEKL